MRRFETIDDCRAIEAEMPWSQRDNPRTIYEALELRAHTHGARNAISFQLMSDPKAPARTLSWTDLRNDAVRAANLFRSAGVGPGDTVALLLPNSMETAAALLGAQIAGIASPINPLLEEDQIAAILRETGAKVLVALRSFPRTDLAQKAARAAARAGCVETVYEIDLAGYLSPPKSWLAALLRPSMPDRHGLKIADFSREMSRMSTVLQFADAGEDRTCAYFHTGGTTGTPKIVRHRYSGMIYNGWIAATLLFDETDNLMCPLPLFHVFAAVVLLNAALMSGAHLVLPTPAGYRGDGVFDNFWKLIERWQITFIITVPTAAAALMQRPVDADVSSVRSAISGSAPLSRELYRRFSEATGVDIMEGYGLTEATCLVSCNPLTGEKKIGSVGLPFPYTTVKIMRDGAGGPVEQAAGEVGEICISSPGVFVGNTYVEPERNRTLYHQGGYLRTGDLGKLDTDGYLWITGRAKDLIIRGGHNIDPAMIEDAIIGHPAVALVGAIGQPDVYAGELPCAYVELIAGASVSTEELLAYAAGQIPERAAIPKYLEILPELPKTAVGKVHKPELRKLAIARVLNAALTARGLQAVVTNVEEVRNRGLVAIVSPGPDDAPEVLAALLESFTVPADIAS